MYTKPKMQKTSIQRNTGYQGETIEKKMQRITNNKEPITDGAPLVYTERKNGVEPQYNIRTDRFEIAIEAMDKVSKSYRAKRQTNIGEQAKEGMKKEQPGETPPNQHS